MLRLPMPVSAKQQTVETLTQIDICRRSAQPQEVDYYIMGLE